MIGYNGDSRTDGMLWLDDSNDVANLTTFAQEHHLPQGTKAYNIDNGDTYIMKSDYTFKKQD